MCVYVSSLGEYIDRRTQELVLQYFGGNPDVAINGFGQPTNWMSHEPPRNVFERAVQVIERRAAQYNNSTFDVQHFRAVSSAFGGFYPGFL